MALSILIFARLWIWASQYRIAFYNSYTIKQAVLTAKFFGLIPLLEFLSVGSIIGCCISGSLARYGSIKKILLFGGNAAYQRLLREIIVVVGLGVSPLITFFIVLSTLHPYLSPEAGYVLSLVAMLLVATLFILKEHDLSLPFPHVRGVKLITQSEAKAISESRVKEDQFKFYFAGIWLPSIEAPQNQLLVGSIGSGKTTHILLHMLSALQHVGEGHRHSAIIYSKKQDIVSFLSAAGLRDYIKILDPFDQRYVAWDIGADIKHPAFARDLMEGIIPPDKSNQPYFRNCGVEVGIACTLGLMLKRGQDWGLEELVQVTLTPERITQFLRPIPELEYIVEQHAHKINDTFQSVVSTASIQLSKLKTIVAAGRNAKERISLTDVITGKDESIIVLHGNDLASQEILPYNRLIITFAAKVALSQTENRDSIETINRRIWFYLDELPTLKKLEILPELISTGRSKGICVAAGIQGISQLNEEYGEEAQETIITNFHHRLFLKNNSVRSQKWCSETYGTHDRVETSMNESTNLWRGGSTGTNAGIQNRPLVLPSEFKILPKASREEGIYGFADIDNIGCYKNYLSPEEISILPSQDEEFPNFVGWSKEKSLKDWLLPPLSEEENEELFGSDELEGADINDTLKHDAADPLKKFYKSSLKPADLQNEKRVKKII